MVLIDQTAIDDDPLNFNFVRHLGRANSGSDKNFHHFHWVTGPQKLGLAVEISFMFRLQAADNDLAFTYVS